MTLKQKGRRHNIGFEKWKVHCFYGSLVQGSSSVFQLNICAENPPLRKAAQTAHLVLPDTQADPLQNQKSRFYQK